MLIAESFSYKISYDVGIRKGVAHNIIKITIHFYYALSGNLNIK